MEKKSKMASAITFFWMDWISGTANLNKVAIRQNYPRGEGENFLRMRHWTGKARQLVCIIISMPWEAPEDWRLNVIEEETQSFDKLLRDGPFKEPRVLEFKFCVVSKMLAVPLHCVLEVCSFLSEIAMLTSGTWDHALDKAFACLHLQGWSLSKESKDTCSFSFFFSFF